MGFWSGITDYVNEVIDYVKDTFTNVTDSISNVADYTKDAFEGVFTDRSHRDKDIIDEYKITPIEDKQYEYDLWIRTVGLDILPDYEDYFKLY